MTAKNSHKDRNKTRGFIVFMPVEGRIRRRMASNIGARFLSTCCNVWLDNIWSNLQHVTEQWRMIAVILKLLQCDSDHKQSI